MQIVAQTKIAFAGFMMLFISQIVYAIQNPSMAKMFVSNLVGFALVSMLGLYVINCSVVGHCDLYAWVVGYIVAALGVILVVVLIFKNMISS
jgi:hypothetical protein